MCLQDNALALLGSVSAAPSVRSAAAAFLTRLVLRLKACLALYADPLQRSEALDAGRLPDATGEALSKQASYPQVAQVGWCGAAHAGSPWR